MAAALPPLPPPNTPLVQQNGSTGQAHAQYLAGLDRTVRSGDFPALSVNGNPVLTTAGGQTVTGGFAETEVAVTVVAGSLTPDPKTSLKQSVSNTGAFTIHPSANVGDVELHVTNGVGAGTISFAGFTKQWTGDALDTTVGHQFVIFIYTFASASAYLVKSLQ